MRLRSPLFCYFAAANSHRLWCIAGYLVVLMPFLFRASLLRMLTSGLSRRRIERLFRHDLNCMPKRYYPETRLRRARELLLQTAMYIMDVTAPCVFQSPPRLSKCSRKQFGYPPTAERKPAEGKPVS